MRAADRVGERVDLYIGGMRGGFCLGSGTRARDTRDTGTGSLSRFLLASAALFKI